MITAKFLLILFLFYLAALGGIVFVTWLVEFLDKHIGDKE